MKTTQHTPGPWKIVSNGMDYLAIGDRKANIIEWPISYSHVDYANAQFIVTACNAHYELIDVLCSIINGSVRISDKANDMLSEHDPKVIRARAIIGQLLLDAMKGDCDAAIQFAQGKE